MSRVVWSRGLSVSAVLLILATFGIGSPPESKSYVPTVRRILVHGVEKQDTAVVQFLTVNHYPLDGVDEITGFQPLVLASWRNINPIFTLLIDAGAKVNVSDKFGITPLHGAAKNNNIEALDRLLQKGAQIMVEDKNGVTPSRLAVERQAEAALERIKQHVKIDSSMAELRTFEEKSFRRHLETSMMSSEEQEARAMEYIKHFQDL